VQRTQFVEHPLKLSKIWLCNCVGQQRHSFGFWERPC